LVKAVSSSKTTASVGAACSGMRPSAASSKK
jgi:hypothetical protein